MDADTIFLALIVVVVILLGLFGLFVLRDVKFFDDNPERPGRYPEGKTPNKSQSKVSLRPCFRHQFTHK